MSRMKSKPRQLRQLLQFICLATFALGICASLMPEHFGAQSSSHPNPPTFFRDVLPILQQHCQTCHRSQGISSTPLETYLQVSTQADDLVRLTAAQTMPPWFADPKVGHFANDPSLNAQELSTLNAWLQGGKLKGDPTQAPPPKLWSGGWNISRPDAVIKMPVPVNVPSAGDVEYTYEIIPTGFTEDKWAQSSQIVPFSPQFVHHAVVYIRPPNSTWLRKAPLNVPFTASSLHDEKLS